MEEIWKAIQGHTGYEVSNLGRARSIDRLVTYKRSGAVHQHRGKILKSSLVSGYPTVALNYNEFFLVHRLVLLTFIGPPPDRHEACHNDGVKTNNRLDNLRWDTRKNNHADKISHGTHLCGEKHGNAKLTCDAVLSIRKDTRLLREIADDYGISKSLVSQVRNRQIWTHI